MRPKVADLTRIVSGAGLIIYPYTAYRLGCTLTMIGTLAVVRSLIWAMGCDDLLQRSGGPGSRQRLSVIRGVPDYPDDYIPEPGPDRRATSLLPRGPVARPYPLSFPSSPG